MEMPESIAEKGTHDPAVDGLRGLAILLVITCHVSLCTMHDPLRPYSTPLLQALDRGGSGGVSLFFVLSAFTLMRSTTARFPKELRPKLAFYIRRAFRILPIWWCYVPLSAAVRHAPKSEILPHLLMYFGFQSTPSFTRIGWS